jgi:hypothetical protein
MSTKVMILLSLLGLAYTSASFAAQPSTINYTSRGSTLTGKKYKIYTVRCSDGKKREITHWDDEKGDRQWCVGKASSKECSASQLKAAAQACK